MVLGTSSLSTPHPPPLAASLTPHSWLWEAQSSGTKRDLVIVPPPQCRRVTSWVEELRISAWWEQHRMSPFGSAAMEDAEAPASSEKTYLLHVAYFLKIKFSQYNVWQWVEVHRSERKNTATLQQLFGGFLRKGSAGMCLFLITWRTIFILQSGIIFRKHSCWDSPGEYLKLWIIKYLLTQVQQITAFYS